MVNLTEAQARAQFEALLFEPILQPLTLAFGEYGDIVSTSFAEVLAKEFAS